ncbi:phage tail protein [Nostoc sp. LPT]|uniref:phage tail protein n=1 Tax=Nostoc sp. LPT TaxID=2815387 RepID=UPI001D72EFC8|nr:phage tail protein [Nostoc sp. LPT]MBN4004299.1 phage tail protein [Nostoc sp. LPT]
MPEKKIITCSDFYFSAGSKIKDLPVQEFSNMGMEVTTTEQVAGTSQGGNPVRQSKPGKVRSTNVTIVLAGTESKSAYQWFAKVNPFGSENPQYKNQLEDAKISGYYDGNVVMEWQIKQCFPCKYQVSSMKAGGAEIVTETIEIVAQEITREK